MTVQVISEKDIIGYTVENTPPPKWLYKKIKKRFGAENVDFDKGIIFTVGDTIYYKGELRQDLHIHERTHIGQQLNMGVKKWWKKYLKDDQFRYEQEVEAYRRQYRWIRQNIKDRSMQNDLLRSCASSLSSPLYGGIVTMDQAIRDIINNK